MGTFSGMQHLKMSPLAFWVQQLPWKSASPCKGFFLWWMIQWPVWNYSYLSLFADDAVASNKSSLVPTSTINDNDNDNDNDESPAPQLINFRDAMIRLAYYSTIDNTLHMTWLRYFYPFGEGEPYTAYFNNSEVLSILLALEMIAWTCLKVREKSETQEDDVEKGMDLIELY
jgi:hypothetical protein